MLIEPETVLPRAFGLQWGATRSEVKIMLHSMITRERARHLYAQQLHGEQEYTTVFSFDDQHRLERISLVVRQSRSFWDGDWTYDEMEQIAEELEEVYHSLIEQYQRRLGSPRLSAYYGDEDYPDDAGVAALTRWSYEENVIELVFDHPDKEFPIYVEVRGYLDEAHH